LEKELLEHLNDTKIRLKAVQNQKSKLLAAKDAGSFDKTETGEL